MKFVAAKNHFVTHHLCAVKKLLAVLFLYYGIANAQSKLPPFYSEESSAWADSIMEKISLEEKIGQLFMAAAWSNKDTNHTNSIRELIGRNHIGGLIFFQGGPVREALLTNAYQKVSSVPLLIGMDAE